MTKISSLHSLRFVKVRSLSQGELKSLYYIHDRIAQLLTETLSVEPVAAAQWQVIGVEQATFGDVLKKYPRDTVWSLLGFGDSLVGGIALVLNKDAAISFVRQSGASNPLLPENEITEFELSQIDNRLQQFSEAFATIWGEYHPLNLQLATFPNTPSLDEFRNLLVGIAPDTTVAMVTFRVMMVARDVQQVTLVFPQPYLEPLVPVLQAVLQSTQSDADFEQIQERIAAVDDITTSVVVELGTTQMTFEELQNMEISDFIRLDQTIDESLSIRVGKDTLIKGRPGTSSDGLHLAVQVSELS